MKKFLVLIVLLFATQALALPANQMIGSFYPALTTSIANGATESAEINTSGAIFTGFYTPAAFTGTAVTFEASKTTGGTFLPVSNAAGAVSITVTTSHYYAVDPKDFQGIQFLKIKSGSTEGGARTISYSMRGID